MCVYTCHIYIYKIKKWLEKFQICKNLIEIKSEEEGYVKTIDALAIGLGSCHLGGGRLTMEDTIDMSAGIILNKKVGDQREN